MPPGSLVTDIGVGRRGDSLSAELCDVSRCAHNVAGHLAERARKQGTFEK